MTKEHPILFSGPMVRAILEGRKTVTRRVVKPQPSVCEGCDDICWHPHWEWSDRKYKQQWMMEDKSPLIVDRNPFGQPGDRLWVRETWRLGGWLADEPTKRIKERDNIDQAEQHLHYLADEPEQTAAGWRPSIHMPRWASRITLEVTGVRVERLQEISWCDAIQEGCKDPRRSEIRVDRKNPKSPLFQFRKTWDALNVKRGFSWESNPWVWVVEFKRLEST